MLVIISAIVGPKTPTGVPDAKISADLASTSGTPTSVSAGPEPTPRGPDVTAAELHDAYAANEIAADSKYKDKALTVHAVIRRISKNAFDQPYLSLASGQEFADVQAHVGRHGKLTP